MLHNLLATCWQLVVSFRGFAINRNHMIPTFSKMAELEEDDIMVLACSSIILSAVAISYNCVVKRRRRHSVWVRGYLKDREKYGAFNCLMPDLHMHDAEKLKNYLRMDPTIFEDLFQKLEPLLTVRSTRFR